MQLNMAEIMFAVKLLNRDIRGNGV